MNNQPDASRQPRRIGRWIAIAIFVLPVLLYCVMPPFSDAIRQAEEAAIKSKSRAIWTAVLTANMERKPLGLPPLWPADITYGDPPVPVKWRSSVQYFRYLMSSTHYTGDPLLAVPSEKREERRVPDLYPEALTVAGVHATATTAAAFGVENCAWHVCLIGDRDAAETPFLITRNVQVEQGEIRKIGDGSKLLTLLKVKPFGKNRALWLVRGGGVLASRSKYLTQAKLLPGTNRVEVIVCR